MQTTEERALRAALTLADGSPQRAAEMLEVSRMTVWRRMKKYGIQMRRVAVSSCPDGESGTPHGDVA